MCEIICTYWFFFATITSTKKRKTAASKVFTRKDISRWRKVICYPKEIVILKNHPTTHFWPLLQKASWHKVFSKEVKLAAMVISHGSNVLLPPSFFIYVDLRTVLCYHNGMTFDYYFGGGKCIGKYFYFAMPASCRLLSRLCKELHATTSSTLRANGKCLFISIIPKKIHTHKALKINRIPSSRVRKFDLSSLTENKN